MKILDNNALTHIRENDLPIKGTFHITPDVLEEYEVQFDLLPANVLDISKVQGFDGALYLKNYQEVLNRRHNRSFYNMKGFGDISILALLITRKTLFLEDPMALMEEHIIVTSDNGLANDIKAQFNDPTNEFDQSIRAVRYEDYTW